MERDYKQVGSLRQRLLRRTGKLRMQFIPMRRLRRERLSVVFATFNRGGRRLVNCLESLCKQTIPRECYEVIVCDVGSDAEHLAELRQVCREHGVRLICLNRQGELFCKAVAINTAIKATDPTSTYVLQTDIDSIFARNCVEQILRASVRFSPAFVRCGTHRLGSESDTVLSGFTYPRDLHRLCGMVAEITGSMGACMCTPREWLVKVGGIDERFKYYGYEDWDLNKRAHADGLNDVGIGDWTRIYHQWHPHAGDLSNMPAAEREHRQRCIDEAWHLFQTETSIVRNPAGWGAEYVEVRLD